MCIHVKGKPREKSSAEFLMGFRLRTASVVHAKLPKFNSLGIL
jgi:hypothetical protein